MGPGKVGAPGARPGAAGPVRGWGLELDAPQARHPLPEPRWHCTSRPNPIAKREEVKPERERVQKAWEIVGNVAPGEQGGCTGPGWGELGARTAFGLEVGDAVHDDVVEEEGLVVHLDAAGQQPAEVVDVPAGGTGRSGAVPQRGSALGPPPATTTGQNPGCDHTPGPTSSGRAVPPAPPCPRRSASWQTCPEPGRRCGDEG